MSTSKHQVSMAMRRSRPKWLTFMLPEFTEAHIIPDADIYEHDMSSKCQCSPSTERWNNGYTGWIHNSFDGRELVEMVEQGQELV